MSWRLKIVHTTRFAYDSAAHASYNEARLTPPTLLTQTTLESRIEIEPPAPVYRYHDYWGTQVSAFDLDDEHSELVVTATSTVETTKSQPRPEPSITWLALQHPTTTDRFAEYLAQTTRTAVDDELVAEVREQVQDLSPNETALQDFVVATRRRRVRAGLNRRADQRARGMAPPPGSLPRHRPPLCRPAAALRHSGPLRLGLRAPEAQCA